MSVTFDDNSQRSKGFVEEGFKVSLKTFINELTPITKVFFKSIAKIFFLFGNGYIRSKFPENSPVQQCVDDCSKESYRVVDSRIERCVDNAADRSKQTVDPCIKTTFSVYHTVISYLPWFKNNS